jgi:hypothetical protein
VRLMIFSLTLAMFAAMPLAVDAQSTYSFPSPPPATVPPLPTPAGRIGIQWDDATVFTVERFSVPFTIYLWADPVWYSATPIAATVGRGFGDQWVPFRQCYLEPGVWRGKVNDFNRWTVNGYFQLSKAEANQVQPIGNGFTSYHFWDLRVRASHTWAKGFMPFMTYYATEYNSDWQDHSIVVITVNAANQIVDIAVD